MANSNYIIYLWTKDGDAVTTMVHKEDVAEFLADHPDAVVTDRR